ncbi:MAG: CRISPR-associated endoribonuclease Cas6 [Cyclobacteriaceae bacterium]|jgi:CRISPR-associated endoribonuclease Cas6
MRIRVTFRVKNKGVAIPFHHQYLISQVIKGLVLFSDAGQYNHFDLYSFSGLKGQTKTSRTGLHYTSKYVTIVFSSPSQGFLKFLASEILKQSHLEIGQLLIVPDKVDEELPAEVADEMKFICISPMVILKPKFNSDHGKTFIEPGTDEYSDKVYEATLSRMEASGIDTSNIKDIEKFQLVPDLEYIKKIRESQKKFARVYPVFDRDVKFEIRGYTFPFTLYAPEEVQQFIYTCGIGEYAHKGFGLLDMANSDPIKRSVPFESNHLTFA